MSPVATLKDKLFEAEKLIKRFQQQQEKQKAPPPPPPSTDLRELLFRRRPPVITPPLSVTRAPVITRPASVLSVRRETPSLAELLGQRQGFPGQQRQQISPVSARVTALGDYPLENPNLALLRKIVSYGTGALGKIGQASETFGARTALGQQTLAELTPLGLKKFGKPSEEVLSQKLTPEYMAEYRKNPAFARLLIENYPFLLLPPTAGAATRLRAGAGVLPKVAGYAMEATTLPVAERVTGAIVGAGLKYGVGIPTKYAGAKVFQTALDSGLDRWIATQGRLLPGSRSLLGKILVSDRVWLIEKATNNYVTRLAEAKAARTGTQRAVKQAVEDTIRDLETRLVPKWTPGGSAIPGQTKSLAEIMAGVEMKLGQPAKTLSKLATPEATAQLRGLQTQATQAGLPGQVGSKTFEALTAVERTALGSVTPPVTPAPGVTIPKAVTEGIPARKNLGGGREELLRKASDMELQNQLAQDKWRLKGETHPGLRTYYQKNIGDVESEIMRRKKLPKAEVTPAPEVTIPKPTRPLTEAEKPAVVEYYRKEAQKWRDIALKATDEMSKAGEQKYATAIQKAEGFERQAKELETIPKAEVTPAPEVTQPPISAQPGLPGIGPAGVQAQAFQEFGTAPGAGGVKPGLFDVAAIKATEAGKPLAGQVAMELPTTSELQATILFNQNQIRELESYLTAGRNRPPEWRTKADLQGAIASLKAENSIAETIQYYQQQGQTLADVLASVKGTIADIESELGNRSMPYHGRAVNIFPNMTTKELDAQLKTYQNFVNSVEASQTPVIPTPTTAPRAKAEVTPRPTSKQAAINAQRLAREREARIFQETEAKFAEESASTESISEREARRKVTLAEPAPAVTAKPQAAKAPPAKTPTTRKRVAAESETQRVKAIQEQGKADPASIAPQDAKEAHIEMAAPDGPRSPIPPKGTPPSQRDPDNIMREITDKATPGERPDQTLLRLHEAAIGSEQRRINIAIRQGNEKLKALGIGVVRRGNLIPRTEDIAKLDELYIALHNPSKVASGEVKVPEGFEAIYKELRELTDWESAARLDFDPNMATVDDYFYRGWKPPEGAFADVKQGRPLVKTPAFKKPRVNATYQEMREAGFEPLFWNPYQQWGISRLQGTKYREQMELVAHLKGMGDELIRVDAGGPSPQGWRVPEVGPAFEGKPFATIAPDGEPTVMFTRRWTVPDKVANTLENIYGKKPNLGRFVVAGKTIDPLAVIDWLTFLPKRAKLFGSFFQQIDFLTRSGAGSWTRLVDAIAEGKPIKGLTALARYPQSVGAILKANFSPAYRQKLAQQLDSTASLIKDRPGINLKGISEAGLSTRDVTIFPADMDKLVRQVADESGVLAKGRRWVGALEDLESAMRRGLFDGVYTAAITTDIKNNIAPMIARQFSHLNDAQINGMIARVANIKYSTVPASQSVIQNRVLREGLRRLFFSTGEAEGLLRQASGAFHGPYAGFWRKYWLGVYLFLIATANVIHYASTREPLPKERYVPISKNEWGPLPFGYNTQFAAPTLPIKGTGGEEMTLDIAGQMDTAFRVLDPAFFIQARQSVPVRATINQVSGTDFYGERIDDVGPGGVVSRTAQLATDLFSPIGVGGVATEVARRSIPMGEEIVPRGERRIGLPGLGIQATGFNVRAITWRTKWADDFKAYDAIPSDDGIAKAQGRGRTRTGYRQAYPDIDAKLFITGQVDTVSTDMAIEAVIGLVRENEIDPETIPGVKANKEKRAEIRAGKRAYPVRVTLTDKLVRRLGELETPAPVAPAVKPKKKLVLPRR